MARVFSKSATRKTFSSYIYSVEHACSLDLAYPKKSSHQYLAEETCKHSRACTDKGNSSAPQIYTEPHMPCRPRTVFATCSAIQIVYGGSRHCLSFSFPPHLSHLSVILPCGEKVSSSAERVHGDGAVEARPKCSAPSPPPPPPQTGGPSGAGAVQAVTAPARLTSPPPPPTRRRARNGRRGGAARWQRGATSPPPTSGWRGGGSSALSICRCCVRRRRGTVTTTRLGARSAASSSFVVGIFPSLRHRSHHLLPMLPPSPLHRYEGIAWGHAPSRCTPRPTLASSDEERVASFGSAFFSWER